MGQRTQKLTHTLAGWKEVNINIPCKYCLYWRKRLKITSFKNGKKLLPLSHWIFSQHHTKVTHSLQRKSTIKSLVFPVLSRKGNSKAKVYSLGQFAWRALQSLWESFRIRCDIRHPECLTSSWLNLMCYWA